MRGRRLRRQRRPPHGHEHLPYSLLLPSRHDAATAPAALLGGSTRFVAAMNSLIRQAGLTNTHLTNPDGRDAPDNYTSALDIGLLGRQLMAIPALRTIAG